MVKFLGSAVCLVSLVSGSLYGQARTTASRTADLQVGVGFVVADSDYSIKKIKGVAFYTTLDLSTHFGGEFEIHQADSRTVRRQALRTDL